MAFTAGLCQRQLVFLPSLAPGSIERTHPGTISTFDVLVHGCNLMGTLADLNSPPDPHGHTVAMPVLPRSGRSRRTRSRPPYTCASVGLKFMRWAQIHAGPSLPVERRFALSLSWVEIWITMDIESWEVVAAFAVTSSAYRWYQLGRKLAPFDACFGTIWFLV